MTDHKHDIEKYLRGELTPAEMHALEKKALSDPFLADALEGAEHAGHDSFLLDVSILQHAINQQTRTRKSKVISLNGWGLTLSIAASLALLIISTFVVLNTINKQNEAQQLASAQTEMTEQELFPVSGDSLTVYLYSAPKTSPAPVRQVRSTRIHYYDIASTQVEPQREVEVEVQEVPVIEAEELKPVTAGSLAKDKAGNESLKQLSGYADLNADSVTNKGDIMVTKNAEELKKTYRDETRQKALGVIQADSIISDKATIKIVKGKVLSSEDNKGVPGVNVVIKGTSVGTVTDEEGNYQIALQKDQALVFSYIGLHSTEVNVKEQEQLNVVMNPDASQLSEVVVTGYGADADRDDIASLQLAEPSGGRKAFKEYLEERVQYPEEARQHKVEGKVTVQFDVEPNGQLTNFKILKGIGYGCDEEVIRLIKEGPKWTPSKTSNKPVKEKVKVRIKFDLPD